jgi:hypothetical protein
MTSVAEIRSALGRAEEALLAAPVADGHLWEDFASTAGSSSEWVTGFVLWALGGKDDNPAVAAATRALIARQREDGSWGYSPKVPGDADSTAWALIGLGAGLDVEHRTAGASFLLDQQVGGGGFRTYGSGAPRALVPWAPRDRHFRGWTSPHTCVTAVVVRSLVEAGTSPCSPAIAAGARYLASRQQPEGLWPSYWWSGLTYTSYHALCSLRRCGALSKGQLKRAVGEVLRRQQPQGGWAWDGSENGRPGAFETAFALMLLDFSFASPAAANGLEDAIERGAGWLCHNQSSDGKWRAEPILRVPLPSDPDEHMGNWECRSRPGALGADVKGVFSAAAVARCLAGYLERRDGDRLGSRVRARSTSVVPANELNGATIGPGSPLWRFLVVNEARAAYASAMYAQGLGIADNARSAVLSTDRELARRISRGLPAFDMDGVGGPPGDLEGACRQGSVFSARWRAKVGSVLGFGAGMAEVLAAAQGLNCAAESAELGAVLLLGTAALDHVCDESLPLREELLGLLTAEVVHDLCSAPASQRSPGARRGKGFGDGLGRLASRAEHADVRYVLRLVGAFFQRLDDWLEPGPARARVGSLLTSAYDAERGTISEVRGPPSSGKAGDTRTALNNGVAVRVLPFMVMTTLNCGLAWHSCARRGGEGAESWPCDRPAKLLGRAVAALDDLADLCMDVRSGAQNSLLLSVAASAPGDGCQRPDDLLRGVIATGACWTAARTVASASAELLRGADAQGGGPQARQRLLAHFWGWGNLGRQSGTGRWKPEAPAVSSGRPSRPRSDVPRRPLGTGAARP